jgi:sugar phosphate isomerase/epimerase
LDVGPAEAVGVAHDAGWPAVGIWFDADVWTDRTTQSVQARLRETGTVALDVEPVILGPDGDVGDALIEAAIELEARFVLVASRQPVTRALVDRFGSLCDRASGSGITVVMEFLPIFAVASLAQALTVVRDAARPNSGVLIDTLHLARSGGSVADLTTVDPRLFPYLQLADAPSVPIDDSIPGLVKEALHGRVLLGDGQLDVAGLLDAVPDVPLSFELRSRSLMDAYPDPVQRARAVLDNWRKFARDRERVTGIEPA